MKKQQSGIDVLESAYLQATDDLYMEAVRFERQEREVIQNSTTEEVREHTTILNQLNKQRLDRRAVVPSVIFRQLVNQMDLYTFRTMNREGE